MRRTNRCIKCHTEKKEKEFYKDLIWKNVGICVPCHKTWRKLHYINTRLHTIKKTAKWKLDNPDKQLGYIKAYMEKNKDIYMMYQLFKYYEDDGLTASLYAGFKNLMIKDGSW